MSSSPSEHGGVEREAHPRFRALLEEVLPYLTEKRKQAELVVQLIQAKEDGTDRATEREIVEGLRRLNAQN